MGDRPVIDALKTIVTQIGDAMVSAVFFAVSIAGVDVNLIVLWLLAGMVFFTVRLGFLNVRGLGHSLRALKGRYSAPGAPGEMTPFQAFATALSGTVGLGNIAGVAIAIAIGGPGAAFWMVVVGFFAMSLKFAEVTIAVRHRLVEPDGRVSGGPMWYLSLGLLARGLSRVGKVLGGLYAIIALFALIQILQVNQSYSQFSTVIGFDGGNAMALTYGTIMAGLAGWVLIGGAHSVGRVTEKLTPIMCGIYLVGVIVILSVNADQIGPAAALIINSAFSPDAAAGGILGAFVAGMRRAVYSNEAGIGTASIAHSAVATDVPASQGYVALLEPMVDTLIVCSATALMIVATGVWDDGHADIAMTSAAFGSVSSWFPIILAICVTLFAFSTVLAAGYYGQQVCRYLFGKRVWPQRIYLLIFCGILPIGTITDVGALINIVDSFFFLLAVPNLIGLYLLTNAIRAEVTIFHDQTPLEKGGL